MEKRIPPRNNPELVKIAREKAKMDYEQKVTEGRLRKGVPARYHRLFLRCKEKSATPRQAIKAFCLECVGYNPEHIVDCLAPKCPMYEYRPYQPKAVK